MKIITAILITLATIGLSKTKEAGSSDSSPPQSKRHIVFILTEDQGPDLGCLGTKGLDTPNIDVLGQSGVIFEKAFALSPVCSPSKMALFTGTYPHTNSAYRNVRNYGVNFPLKGDPSDLRLGGVHEDLPTLIEILRKAGWHTAISSKSHVQPIRKFPYHQGHPNPGTPAAAAKVIQNTFRAAGDRPVFLCFNVGSPHLPFRALPRANGVWDPKGGLLGDGGVTNVDPASIEVPNSMPDVPGVRQDWADYYGSIEVVDSLFGTVQSSLADLGLTDKTLLVFSSDHGIGLHRFKQSIYGLQVPLLIDGPNVEGNRRISEPVSHFDLAPTFLDFAGIETPASMGGKSLLPILSGKEKTTNRKTVLTACHERYDARAVCDGRYYFVRNLRQVEGATLAQPAKALNADQFQGGKPWFNRAYDATVAATGSPQRKLLKDLVEGKLPDTELYDLENDPWCANNLADKPALAPVIDRLKKEMTQWRASTHDYQESPKEMKRRGFSTPQQQKGSPR
ncbi:MAG: sulfatase [Akkermansiaceae bacterium]